MSRVCLCVWLKSVSCQTAFPDPFFFISWKFFGRTAATTGHRFSLSQTHVLSLCLRMCSVRFLMFHSRYFEDVQRHEKIKRQDTLVFLRMKVEMQTWWCLASLATQTAWHPSCISKSHVWVPSPGYAGPSGSALLITWFTTQSENVRVGTIPGSILRIQSCESQLADWFCRVKYKPVDADRCERVCRTEYWSR